ncbi:MAG: hypothetical protein H8E44_07795 [Planctomycetes bacterium]|nr:hypothetical protein [Planctomycetota bacterium]MBL7042830.1 hypothetical protein [Pirellulaceae bacterium]
MSLHVSDYLRSKHVYGLCGVLVLGAVLAACSTGLAETRAEKQRNADGLVREALNREIYGMEQQRQELLDRALDLVPGHPAAHWHTGHVFTGREWVKASDANETPGQQRQRELYERQRAQALDTAEDQLALADWCADRNLPLREIAHLNRIIQLSPDHPGARARLGYQRVGGAWIKSQDIWQGMRNAEQITVSVRKWQPAFETIRKGLRQETPRQRAAAEERLKATLTPEAVPALEAVLATDSEACALAAVRALEDMPGHEAAGALARQAVFSPWSTVRHEAASGLAKHPRDHYVPMLLAELSSPIESRIQTAMAGGRILYRHSFEREGQDAKQVNVLDTAFQRRASLVLTDDPTGAVNPVAGNRALTAARADTVARAMRDMQAMASSREWTRLRQNTFIHGMNDRICQALSVATGADLPPAPQVWWDWWNKQNEITFADEKPSEVAYNQDVRVYEDIISVTASGDSGGTSGRSRPPCECFVAGTPVWTVAGMVDIDKVKVGDLVLSQNPDTGELAYKPVLRVTVRPPEPLIKVRLASPRRTVLEGSGGHPLWVAGDGWILLRKIRSGMVLHGVDGSVVVSDVDEGGNEQTYNLIVLGFSTYVVGDEKILCHDNTPRGATNALVPGLLQE